MQPKAAITVRRPIDEVKAAWGDHFDDGDGAEFAEAPRGQGTEIRVAVGDDGDAMEKVMVGLRRFKQVLETGEVVRSDGSPDGASIERLLKQRPAQPVEQVPS